jgi:transposase-like protein
LRRVKVKRARISRRVSYCHGPISNYALAGIRKLPVVLSMQISPFKFDCPTCAARYKIVKIEADAAQDPEITCRCCGRALNGREGVFALKYFLVDPPKSQGRLHHAG